MNIYVGNLSWGLKDQDLANLFAPFGEVTSAKIVTDKFTQRSKGFGFVEMANDEEAQAAIARAGLPADYQPVPMLNFANIAFEQQGEQSLKLLDDIFQRAAEGAGSFLSPAEVAKLQEFRATALSNNRGSLSVNRAIMAPIGN